MAYAVQLLEDFLGSGLLRRFFAAPLPRPISVPSTMAAQVKKRSCAGPETSTR